MPNSMIPLPLSVFNLGKERARDGRRGGGGIIDVSMEDAYQR